MMRRWAQTGLSVLTLMAALSLTAAATTTASPALTADDRYSVFGTHAVGYEPLQSNGETFGCALSYHVIASDTVRRQGRPVSVVGNIVFYGPQAGKVPFMVLKMGIIEVVDGKTVTTPPNFAYLQTPSGNTALSRMDVRDSEATGYRMFSYRFNAETLTVFDDLLSGKDLTLAFNEGSSDAKLAIPLDLEVMDATPRADGLSFQRRYSIEFIDQFRRCFVDLMNRSN